MMNEKINTHLANDLEQSAAMLDSREFDAVQLDNCASMMRYAATVIRQALEQPAPDDHIRDATKMVPPPECKTEAEKTAYAFGWYKALESVRKEPVIQDWMKPDALCDRSCLYACTEGFTKFPTCVPPTSPAQEPDPDELAIAYLNGIDTGKKRKPWVGLTNEEFVELCSADLGTAALIRAVESRLKEKNTKGGAA